MQIFKILHPLFTKKVHDKNLEGDDIICFSNYSINVTVPMDWNLRVSTLCKGLKKCTNNFFLNFPWISIFHCRSYQIFIVIGDPLFIGAATPSQGVRGCHWYFSQVDMFIRVLCNPKNNFLKFSASCCRPY
jgi:hypothetical protein